MEDKQINLKSYRKDIEVLELTIDIPYYEDVEKRFIYGTYESTLLRLFNNKRENEEILDIRNYYDSNKITLVVNLTAYMEDNRDSKEECIKHLKNWLIGNFDIATSDVKEYIHEGHIFEVYEHENGIDSLDDYVRVVM